MSVSVSVNGSVRVYVRACARARKRASGDGKHKCKVRARARGRVRVEIRVEVVARQSVCEVELDVTFEWSSCGVQMFWRQVPSLSAALLDVTNAYARTCTYTPS